MFRKFFLKSIIFCVITSSIVFGISYWVDTFNIFHWKNIRFTSAEPNKNYIKTQYILHNPDLFNAFVFGSSRVGNLPQNGLPESLSGEKLRWYNMTHSVGLPAEHLLTLKTFLAHGVDVKVIFLGFDDILMINSPESHRKELLRLPYQVYEESKWNFYKPYLKKLPAFSLIKEIAAYKTSEHQDDTELFYSYGTLKEDFSLTEDSQLENYPSAHKSVTGYTQTNAYQDIFSIAQLCADYGITLILFTNPLYSTTYRDAVDDGYLSVLQKVGESVTFYNFSSLNAYTQNPQYFFEGAHYRPALGLLMEKMVFGTEEERAEIRRKAGDELFGVKVTPQNVDEIVRGLQNQIQSQ